MKETKPLDRITVEPGKMNGHPCIRGMRLTVRRVLEALTAYPNREGCTGNTWLRDEDIQQALEYAAATRIGRSNSRTPDEASPRPGSPPVGGSAPPKSESGCCSRGRDWPRIRGGPGDPDKRPTRCASTCHARCGFPLAHGSFGSNRALCHPNPNAGAHGSAARRRNPRGDFTLPSGSRDRRSRDRSAGIGQDSQTARSPQQRRMTNGSWGELGLSRRHPRPLHAGPRTREQDRGAQDSPEPPGCSNQNPEGTHGDV